MVFHYKYTTSLHINLIFIKNLLKMPEKNFQIQKISIMKFFSIPLYVDLKYKDLKYIGKSINTLIKN